MSKFIILAVALLPFTTSAATYHYVTVDGETASVEAASPEDAFAQARDIAPHSGVALDAGYIEPGMEVPSVALSVGTEEPMVNGGEEVLGTGGSNTFHYVTTEGVTATVQADNPETALAIAPDRAQNSGVAIDEGLIEEGMTVPSVAQ